LVSFQNRRMHRCSLLRTLSGREGMFMHDVVDSPVRDRSVWSFFEMG
jgi:hypothetical protein